MTLRDTGAQAPALADAEALKLKVAVVGGDASALAELPYVTIVTDKASADLVWSVANGTVEHVVGGVVAEGVDAQSIKGVVSKWAALKWLNHQAALSPTAARLVTGNQRYTKGERVEIEVVGAHYPHLTLFNLPPDGRVEFFIPDPAKAFDASKDWSWDGVHESFKVDKPPYGAEHMVAIFSKDDLSDLHAALSGQEAQIGILDIYTGAGGFLPAGKQAQFPGASAPFQFRLKDPGTETVIAICNASGKEADGIKHDFKKRQFTELNNYRDFLTRQIVVEGAEKIAGGKGKSGEKKADAAGAPNSDILSRTAIKLEVK